MDVNQHYAALLGIGDEWTVADVSLDTRTPGPGGAFTFTVKTFGADHGFLIAWFLVLTYAAILWANATALVLLARYLFGDAFQFGFHYTMAGFDVHFGEVLLCILAIAFSGSACGGIADGRKRDCPGRGGAHRESGWRS